MFNRLQIENHYKSMVRVKLNKKHRWKYQVDLKEICD